MIKNFLHLFLIISLNILLKILSILSEGLIRFNWKTFFPSSSWPEFLHVTIPNLHVTIPNLHVSDNSKPTCEWQFQTYMWQFQTYMWVTIPNLHVSDNSKPTCDNSKPTCEWQFQTYMWVTIPNLHVTIPNKHFFKDLVYYIIYIHGSFETFAFN